MKTRLSAALLFLAMPGVALAASDVVVHRDPGCGCCEKWAQAVREKLGRKVVMRDDASRNELQRRAGMPRTLASCHSAIVDGYMIEAMSRYPTSSACWRPVLRVSKALRLQGCRSVRRAWKWQALPTNPIQ